MSSKRKFLQHLKKDINSSDIEELYRSFFKLDHFSINHFKQVLNDNHVPNKDYLDYCFYIEEHFSSFSTQETKSRNYLCSYMSVLYLYCSSKCEEGTVTEIDSLYIRLPIQIFHYYGDEVAANFFYHFLENIDFHDHYVEYFIILGQLMLTRWLGIETNLDTINKKLSRIVALRKEIGSFSNATSSIDCPIQWALLDKDLPTTSLFGKEEIPEILLSSD